jgi:hypothetical protein
MPFLLLDPDTKYAQAVDSFMLVASGSLASAQSTKTKATAQAIIYHSILELLLNTHAHHPDAVLQYHASDMYLHIHSNVYYLCLESKAGSCASMDRSKTSDQAPSCSPNSKPPPPNIAVHPTSQMLCRRPPFPQ